MYTHIVVHLVQGLLYTAYTFPNGNIFNQIIETDCVKLIFQFDPGGCNRNVVHPVMWKRQVWVECMQICSQITHLIRKCQIARKKANSGI